MRLTQSAQRRTGRAWARLAGLGLIATSLVGCGSAAPEAEQPVIAADDLARCMDIGVYAVDADDELFLAATDASAPEGGLMVEDLIAASTGDFAGLLHAERGDVDLWLSLDPSLGERRLRRRAVTDGASEEPCADLLEVDVVGQFFVDDQAEMGFVARLVLSVPDEQIVGFFDVIATDVSATNHVADARGATSTQLSLIADFEATSWHGTLRELTPEGAVAEFTVERVPDAY